MLNLEKTAECLDLLRFFYKVRTVHGLPTYIAVPKYRYLTTMTFDFEKTIDVWYLGKVPTFGYLTLYRYLPT